MISNYSIICTDAAGNIYPLYRYGLPDTICAVNEVGKFVLTDPGTLCRGTCVKLGAHSTPIWIRDFTVNNGDGWQDFVRPCYYFWMEFQDGARVPYATRNKQTKLYRLNPGTGNGEYVAVTGIKVADVLWHPVGEQYGRVLEVHRS